jgi:hypothetical protein
LLDEARVEYIEYELGRKVRIKAGEELLGRNLAPSFRPGQISVGCWAACIHRKRIPLVRVCQRTEWDSIEQKELDNLVDSMPKRIEAIISAEGGHIK